jgi:hypothetical protein
MSVTDEIIGKSYLIRGEILHLCTILEKDIEDFICKYFTNSNDKAQELFVIVLDRMAFDSKISTLEVLLKKIHGDNFDKKYLKLFVELRFVKEHRNAMAHHMVDVFESHKPLKQGVGFINYRNTATVTNYDKGKLKQVIDRTIKCIEVVRAMG